MVNHKKGFTLLELLLVMAVIAILAAVGVKGSNLARRLAKESQAKAELEKLRTALDEYRIRHGGYPSQPHTAAFSALSEIHQLTNSVAGIYLTDPWGRRYRYRSSSRFIYQIWSEGQTVETDTDNVDPAQPGY